MTMLRGIVWKLADETLVFADWKGFCEAALPGNAPGGLLRYVSRLLMTLGLFDWVWAVMLAAVGAVLAVAIYFAIRPFVQARRSRSERPTKPRFTLAAYVLPPLSLLVGEAVVWVPLMGVGASVWVVIEPAFAVMNALGLAAALGLYAAACAARPPYRMTACAGTRDACPYRMAAGAVVAFLLYVPLGSYALIAAALIGVTALMRGVRGAHALPAFACGAIALGLAAATMSVYRPLVYRDRSYLMMWVEGGAFRWAFATGIDLGPQLAMERCVRAQDWQGVMRIADETRRDPKHDTLRMEIAYRILAQYRLGTVMDDLFDYPINSCHNATDAQEALMDGYELLYQYGLLAPAQRECFEQMSAKGWQPRHFQVLGDIALIHGENALAYRYYHQLARCPFRERTDRAQLEKLTAMARVWTRWAAENNQTFFTTDGQNIEGFIYSSFHTLKNANADMVKMFIAASLLENDAKVLTDNFNLFDYFRPAPKPWPRPVQQALVDYIQSLDDKALQQKIVSSIRPYAFEDAVLKNLTASPYYHYAHKIYTPARVSAAQ